MIIVNLYSPFEGEAEIVLKEKNIDLKTIRELHLVQFQFNTIVGSIPTNSNPTSVKSVLTGNGDGWFYEEWECKNVQEFLNQLTALTVPSDLQASYDEMLQICISSLLNNSKLFIELA